MKEIDAAIEALEEAMTYTSSPSWSPSMTEECAKALDGLRSLKEQEPVAWISKHGHMQGNHENLSKRHADEYSVSPDWTPLYTHPAPEAKQEPGDYDLGFRRGLEASAAYREEARAYKEAYFKLVENVASMKAFEPSPPIFITHPAPEANQESAYQRGYLDGMAKPCTDCADYKAMYLKVRDELAAEQRKE